LARAPPGGRAEGRTLAVPVYLRAAAHVSGKRHAPWY